MNFAGQFKLDSAFREVNGTAEVKAEKVAVSAVLSLSFASWAALLMPLATSISLLYPFTRLSSVKTLIGVLGFLPKCAFKGNIFVGFCLHIRNCWKTIFNACFTCNYFVADFSSLKHATIFLIVCINLSTSPIARWSSVGVSIVSALFLLQSFFYYVSQGILLDPIGLYVVHNTFQYIFSKISLFLGHLLCQTYMKWEIKIFIKTIYCS